MKPRALSGLGAALFVAVACCRSEPDANPPGPSADAPASSVGPREASSVLHYKLRTTGHAIAVGNLSGQIAEVERLRGPAPRDLALVQTNVGLLLERSRLTGSLKDRERAFELSQSPAAIAPDDVEAVLLAATGLAAVHRFEEALARIDRADTLNPPPGRTAAPRASVLAALGRHDEAMGVFRPVVETNPSPDNLLTDAVLLSELGKVEDAEARFVDAETKYRGPSPFLLVSIYFERARMWERAGDLEKAAILLRAANERLPEDIHSAVHLAALLPPSEGVKLLEPLSKTSEDPDLMAQLGVLQNLIQEKSGDAAIELAKTRFDDAMSRMPTAYADHAGWFWLGVGADPVKAFAAAEQNLAVRKTADAFELAIAAASAHQRREVACAHAARASVLAYPSAKLTEKIRQLACPPEAPSSKSAAPSARPAP